jgi:hypothetical protein
MTRCLTSMLALTAEVNWFNSTSGERVMFFLPLLFVVSGVD